VRCIDIGASTGGFTEVLLQLGAAAVLALDVGYGQLHPRLRNHPRVTVMERTNFRTWQPESLSASFDLAVMDVSFISIRLLLPKLIRVLKPLATSFLMVKPQFELRREQVPRSGVVKDPELISLAFQSVIDAGEPLGLNLQSTYPAGVSGRKGNQECFVHFCYQPTSK